MNLKINITRDTAGPALSRLIESLKRRRPLNAALGKRAELELRDHFLLRNEEPNKKGWPKQNFWNRIRTATAVSAINEEGATVSVADPAFAQKYYGGQITPKESKYLAIPAIASAYGKSPLSLPELVPIVRFLDGSRRAIALGTRKTEGFIHNVETIYYWLVKQVNQDKDPEAFPDAQRFKDALLEETRDAVSSALK